MFENNTELKCPKCGRGINITSFNEAILMMCPNPRCEWQEIWKRDKNRILVKQRIAPKTMKKIFVIEYTNSDPSFNHACDKLDGETIHELLKSHTTTNITVKTDEYDPNYWEVARRPDKVVKEPCSKCGKIYSTFHHVDNKRLCEKCYTKKCHTEIVKNCNNCEYGKFSTCTNKKDCYEYSQWKSQKPKKGTKFPEHGKNYVFSDIKENENHGKKKN